MARTAGLQGRRACEDGGPARTSGLRGRRFSQNVPQKSNTDCGYPTFDLFSERFPLQELPGQCTWRDGPSVQLLGMDVVARNTDLIVY